MLSSKKQQMPSGQALQIHYLQHVPFEGLGSIESWLHERGHHVSATHMFSGDQLPQLDHLDWLMVMGGPMGVSDDIQYPWLKGEKEFIREAVDSGKVVLGICLGAQLIADALGAPVRKNEYREIGWFPIVRHQEAPRSEIGKIMPVSS